MFRILQSSSGIPYSYPVDPSATFEPGQAAQLTVIGNIVVATVSNGMAPIGIIDDIKTSKMSSTVWNETFIVPCPITETDVNGNIVTSIDMTHTLENSNIIKSSFICGIDVALKDINGVIIIPRGTVLNHSTTNTIVDSIKSYVNYSYYIANIPGDDSTLNSGRVTVWFDRMMIETDQFETNQTYPVNANLYINTNGKFTTAKPSVNHPVVGIVTQPPSPLNPFLGVFWN